MVDLKLEDAADFQAKLTSVFIESIQARRDLSAAIRCYASLQFAGHTPAIVGASSVRAHSTIGTVSEA